MERMAYRYLAVLCVVALVLAVVSLVGRHLAAPSAAPALTAAEETKLEAAWNERFVRAADWAGLRAAAGTAYKRFPGSPIPPYYLAFAEYGAGNREGAISYAVEARERALKSERHFADPRFDQALSRLREGHPEPFPAPAAGE